MEDVGKKSLEKELDSEVDPEKIKGIIEDAKLSGYEDVAEKGEQKLKTILEKVDKFEENIEETTTSEADQVKKLGGSLNENPEVQEVDKQIQNLTNETMAEVEEIKTMNKEAGQETVQENIIAETEKPSEENQGIIEKSEEDLEAEMTNKLVDENIIMMNQELERIKNDVLPADLVKNLDQKKALFQDFGTKITDVNEKIKAYRENSPESLEYNKAIHLHLEKIRDIDDFLKKESQKIEKFDDKKILSIAKKVTSFMLEISKEEFKDTPEKLEEEKKEAQEFLNLPSDELRAKLFEENGLSSDIIHKWDGGSNKYQLENEQIRLDRHKKDIKFVTILTDNEQLIGKSTFEKDLTKKIQELDSANHDLLVKSISYNNNKLFVALQAELEDLNKKRRFVYKNGAEAIADHVSSKRREIDDNTAMVDLSSVSKTVGEMDRNRYSPSNKDKQNREKFGLSKYNKEYIAIVKGLDSWKEKLVKDYFSEDVK